MTHTHSTSSSLDTAGTTVDEGGLVYEVLVCVRIRLTKTTEPHALTVPKSRVVRAEWLSWPSLRMGIAMVAHRRTRTAATFAGAQRHHYRRRPDRRSGQRCGHFPTETAALKCVYLAIMSLDPTGRGRRRWSNRWKEALNAFEITFDGRLSANRK
jgi:hypothetical protein